MQNDNIITYALEDLATVRAMARRMLHIIDTYMDEPEKLKPLIGRASPVSAFFTVARLLINAGKMECSMLGAPQDPKFSEMEGHIKVVEDAYKQSKGASAHGGGKNAVHSPA